LSVLSHIVSSRREDVDGLIGLICEHGSAKEIMIAAQEIVELLYTADEVDASDDTGSVSSSVQLARLFSIYSSCRSSFSHILHIFT
jgi:hypothetical protein